MADAGSPGGDRMIAIFDEDGGGDVDFQEFVSGLSAFSSKGKKEQKLRFAFKVYDIDRDGYISNGELFIVLKMMVGSNLKDQQLQQIVDKTIMEADLDKDGKISFEEFTKMVETTDVSMSMTLGARVPPPLCLMFIPERVSLLTAGRGQTSFRRTVPRKGRGHHRDWSCEKAQANLIPQCVPSSAGEVMFPPLALAPLSFPLWQVSAPKELGWSRRCFAQENGKRSPCPALAGVRFEAVWSHVRGGPTSHWSALVSQKAP